MVKAVFTVDYSKPPIKPTQWMLCDYAIALDLFCAIALDLLFCVIALDLLFCVIALDLLFCAIALDLLFCANNLTQKQHLAQFYIPHHLVIGSNRLAWCNHRYMVQHCNPRS